MHRYAHVCILSMISIVSLISGCIVPQDDDGRLGVVVTIGPQREMAEALGGDKVKVTVMVPAGESPHAYAPTPAQLVEVARSKVYFIVGSGIEFELGHLDDMQDHNQDLRIRDTSAGIELIEMDEHEGGSGIDPHIWLSPSNAKVMVSNMFEGLVEVDPGNRETYEANRDAYLRRLDELDSYIRGLLAGREGSRFLVFHPAWEYFAKDYGLVELAIEEEGKEPGPAGVAAIIEQARDEGIQVVFVSPQFSRSSAQTIADEIGGRVVTVDPLAEEYVANLREVADTLAEGLSK